MVVFKSTRMSEGDRKYKVFGSELRHSSGEELLWTFETFENRLLLTPIYEDKGAKGLPLM